MQGMMKLYRQRGLYFQKDKRAVEFKVDDSENSGDVLDKRQEVKSNFKIYYRARSYIRRQWKLQMAARTVLV